MATKTYGDKPKRMKKKPKKKSLIDIAKESGVYVGDKKKRKY